MKNDEEQKTNTTKKSMKIQTKCISRSAAALLLASAGAQASIVNINLLRNEGDTPMNGTTSSATAAPASYTGTTWNDIMTENGIRSVTFANLKDSENATTAVDLTLSFADTENGVWSKDLNLNLLNSYVWIRPAAGTATYTFSDLAPSAAYDIYIVSQGDSADQGGTFNIGATTKTTSGSDPYASSFIENQNYVKFSVVSSGSGVVTGTWDHFPGQYSALNGIQIVSVSAIPEPSGNLTLLGVFGLLGLWRRRS